MEGCCCAARAQARPTGPDGTTRAARGASLTNSAKPRQKPPARRVTGHGGGISSVRPAGEMTEQEKSARHKRAWGSHRVFKRRGEKSTILLPDCLSDDEVI